MMIRRKQRAVEGGEKRRKAEASMEKGRKENID